MINKSRIHDKTKKLIEERGEKHKYHKAIQNCINNWIIFNFITIQL
jgi:hypothetical protein